MMVHLNGWESRAPSVVHNLAGALGHRVYNVHRLDRATSGVMLFARNREVAAALSQQFRNRSVTKRYVAVVRGHLREVRRVEKPLPGRSGSRVEAISELSPLARTVIPEPLGPYEEAWFSLVSVTLTTGRRHQARLHLRSLDHPVIGDREHGDNRNNRFFEAKTGCRELMLRAVELTFAHPRTGERIAAYSGLPRWWTEVLNVVTLSPPAWLTDEPAVRTGRGCTKKGRQPSR